MQMINPSDRNAIFHSRITNLAKFKLNYLYFRQNIFKSFDFKQSLNIFFSSRILKIDKLAIHYLYLIVHFFSFSVSLNRLSAKLIRSIFLRYEKE